MRLALGGKGLRGIHREALPGVRLVALYDVQAGVVLAQKGGQDPPRDSRRQIGGGADGARLVTGDRLYCQHALCRKIFRPGGHFLFAVKANQTHLAADVALPFEQPPQGLRDRQVIWPLRQPSRAAHTAGIVRAHSLSRGGGLAPNPAGAARRAPPDRAGHCTREVCDIVTSLGTRWAAADFLALVRSYWLIGNTVHYVRDVNFGEGADTIRCGAAPRVMVALRDAVRSLLRQRPWRKIDATLCHYAWRLVAHVLRLLGIPPSHQLNDSGVVTGRIAICAGLPYTPGRAARGFVTSVLGK